MAWVHAELTHGTERPRGGGLAAARNCQPQTPLFPSKLRARKLPRQWKAWGDSHLGLALAGMLPTTDNESAAAAILPQPTTMAHGAASRAPTGRLLQRDPGGNQWLVHRSQARGRRVKFTVEARCGKGMAW
jgi:hypothetical protein